MPKAMRLLPFLLVMTLIGCSAGPTSKPANEYEARYLNDPTTPESFKDAIRSGVVIPGMCPFQAFAAAGPPGPYMVKSDRGKWGPGVPPPTIISAQCEHPDHSVIELMFRNRTQFQSDEPVVFRVRFVEGKVTLIDRKGFNE